VNKQRVGFKVAAVKVPGTGLWRRAMLEDIAVATCGMIIAEQRGTHLENLRL
jgi:chaperonin GroEL